MHYQTQNQQQQSITHAHQQAAEILKYVDSNVEVIKAEMTCLNHKSAMLFGAASMYRNNPTPGLAAWLKLHFDRYTEQERN